MGVTVAKYGDVSKRVAALGILHHLEAIECVIPAEVGTVLVVFRGSRLLAQTLPMAKAKTDQGPIIYRVFCLAKQRNFSDRSVLAFACRGTTKAHGRLASAIGSGSRRVTHESSIAQGSLGCSFV
ncbi:hypothetical protein GUJ93_ZPchr0001g32960 [Zizania palustris]|uniref:Uncharacterized protein n=1 Tax=Zizania palustris TaxID=103762 RepID=A0A8J5RNX9_ZIZPA|nr:hypothetical protein GUJ93_ZPchr0001g32960 [Zizania palustris]